MEKEVVVALVSSLASVVAAVIALVQAVRVSRKAGDASLQLAQLQADAERKKRAFDVALAEAKPIEDALQTAWQDLQAIKEVITKALSGHEFDRESAAADLRAAIGRLSSGYAEHGAQLSPSAQQEWHAAKSAASGAGMSLLRGASLVTDAQKVASELQTSREKLTERQLAIANERQEVRERLTRRMLELL